MTTVRYDNAVTRLIDRPELPYRNQVMKALAFARAAIADTDLAAAVSTVQADYVYLDKIVDGLDDTSRYFDTMIEEWNQQAINAYEQANDESDLDDIVRMRVVAIRAEAKVEAYLDAVRALNVPFIAALRDE
jgi:hypothetical protein